jgi:ubiquinone/menaquinone biosynthesis C-methylase UbiE
MKITDNIQEIYTDQYLDPNIAKWRQIGAKQKAKNILDIIDLVGKSNEIQNILEVGAGDGAILAELSKQNFAKNYQAVEISQSGIHAIEKRNIPQLQKITKFDGYSLPFEDKSFDLIILSHVLEHVEHERILLREIKRVAKYYIIEVPREYRYGINFRLKHFLDYGHINMYTPSSFCFLLGTEKFLVKKMLFFKKPKHIWLIVQNTY